MGDTLAHSASGLLLLMACGVRGDRARRKAMLARYLSRSSRKAIHSGFDGSRHYRHMPAHFSQRNGLWLAAKGFAQSQLDWIMDRRWRMGQRRSAKGHALRRPAERRGDRIGRPLPGPARIGVQMHAQGTMCKIIAQCTQQGKSIDQAIAFGESELEGYMRT